MVLHPIFTWCFNIMASRTAWLPLCASCPPCPFVLITLRDALPQHWDWFDEDELVKMNMMDGNRIATVLMYLSGTAELCRGQRAYYCVYITTPR